MSYSKIPAGKDLPNDIYVAIEIPANHAPIKYEIDKDSDCLFVDRFMATPMFYPANYGFIPNTLADDGDPLDVLVVTPYPVTPGSVIRARPVGILNMTDDGGGDRHVGGAVLQCRLQHQQATRVRASDNVLHANRLSLVVHHQKVAL